VAVVINAIFCNQSINHQTLQYQLISGIMKAQCASEEKAAGESLRTAACWAAWRKRKLQSAAAARAQSCKRRRELKTLKTHAR